MKKYFFLLLIGAAVTTVSFGQATESKVSAAKADPKTTENAAKADAQVVNKKTVVDKATMDAAFKKKKLSARKKKSPYRRTS